MKMKTKLCRLQLLPASTVTVLRMNPELMKAKTICLLLQGIVSNYDPHYQQHDTTTALGRYCVGFVSGVSVTSGYDTDGERPARFVLYIDMICT